MIIEDPNHDDGLDMECVDVLVHALDLAPDTLELPSKTEEEIDDLDTVLAESMKELSVKERQEGLHDVYGVTPLVEETAGFVKGRLQELDRYIDMIPKKPAYARTKSLAPEYCTKFRLMALRATTFDAKQAAERLVEFFEMKAQLFGVDKLTRDIKLSDLDEGAKAQLESGVTQALPVRDRAGRAVLCVFPMLRKEKRSMAELAQVMFYIIMTLLEDEETQKRGTVMVLMNVGPNRLTESFEFMRKLAYFRSTLLDRVVGAHHCHDSKILRPFLSVGVRFIRVQTRARFRPHFGKLEDIKYELLSYGIPTKALPILSESFISTENHKDWLRRRQIQEGSDLEDIVIPRRFDVLFGRGKGISEHTGNLRVGHIVEMHKQRYEAASKYRKTEIAERVVKIIHESNGRFLKQDEGGWEEVSDEVARDKISHFFRKLRSGTTKQDSAKKSKVSRERNCSKTQSSDTSDADSEDGDGGTSGKRLRKDEE